MKRLGRFKKIGFVSIGVMLLFVSTATWLIATPDASHCQGEWSSDSKLYKAHPLKVVFQPWLGRHHVFGVFMIPLRYRSGKRYSGTLSVQSFSDVIRPDQQPEVPHVEDVVVNPGHYLMKGYIPTRVALWFFITGQLGDLRSPCNWTIEFTER